LGPVGIGLNVPVGSTSPQMTAEPAKIAAEIQNATT
jgi:hypothetical protein